MVNTEREKLKTLLKYWIAHNQDHSEEFREWAKKASAMGESEIATAINQAVTEMDKATALFAKSLQKLNGEDK
jgi:rubrerythrin